ncbi:MAG TPA: CBS domain-containing protein, partial [Longimicrobiales bacterium]|nr:CBS domain-containing protein [Longimicrobiales bacterium]
ELAEYTVEDIMTPAAFTVDSDTSVSELARFLLDRRIHRALVVDDGRLEGIVTSFDVLRAVGDAAFRPSGTELLC